MRPARRIGRPGPTQKFSSSLLATGEQFVSIAAERGVSEQDALQKGMEEKSREFVEKGSEIYAKA